MTLLEFIENHYWSLWFLVIFLAIIIGVCTANSE